MKFLKQILLIAGASVASAEAKAMTGVNAGGWMVLEPWITPSLFYRFTEGNIYGGAEGTTAFDTYTFCETIKNHPEHGTANQILSDHWDNFYTEDIMYFCTSTLRRRRTSKTTSLSYTSG